MKLKSIKIENFRGIKKSEINDFTNINIIVGKNNAAKTSVLEAMFLSLGVSNPDLSLRINSFRDLTTVNDTYFKALFYQLNYKNSIHINTTFDTDKGSHERDLTIKPYLGSGNTHSQKISDSNFPDWKDMSSSLDTQEATGLKNTFSIKDFHKKRENYTVEVFFETSSQHTKVLKDYKERIKAIFLTPHVPLGNLNKRLERLITQKRKKAIIKALQTIDNNIQDISLGTGDMIYFDIGIDRLVPIHIMGDGIKKLLSVLVTIVNTHDGIVLIDEIDNGLHFSALKTLCKSIIQLAETFNVQVFLTTHNFEVLKYFTEILDNEEMEKCQEKISCFTVRKLQGDVVKAYKYDFEQFEYAIAQEIEIR